MPAAASFRLERRCSKKGVTEIDLFFSHVHYDHIIGLPYFLPAFWNKVKLRIWAGHMQDGSTPEQLVDGIFRPPYFPITKDYMRADVEYHKFSPGDVLKPSPGVRIVTGSLTHPNGAVGYRVERAGATFCYLTDFEHDGGAGDAEILRLATQRRPCAARRDLHAGGISALRQVRPLDLGAVRRAVRRGRASRDWGMFHHMHMRTDIDQQAIEDAAQNGLSELLRRASGPALRAFRASRGEAGSDDAADALPAAARFRCWVPGRPKTLPTQVAAAIEEQENRGEILVKLIQLLIVSIWGVLYAVAPKAGTDGIAHGALCDRTLSRRQQHRPGLGDTRRLPDWSVYFSIVFDMLLLYAVIWRFHVLMDSRRPSI